MKTQPKKRGRPVGSKTNKFKTNKFAKELEKSNKEIFDKVYKVHADDWQKQWDAIPDSEATVEQVKDWSRFKPQGETVEEMSLVNKITLVLTVVNVAILISLVIKNV